jgi:Skp family chaperone for outer membrane proteins
MKLINTLRIPTVAALAAIATAMTLHSVGAENRASQLIATVNLGTIYDPAGWKRFESFTKVLDQKRDNYKQVIGRIVPEQGGGEAVPPLDRDSLEKWIALEQDIIFNTATATTEKTKQEAAYEEQAKVATERLQALIAKGNGISAAEKDEYDKLMKLRQDASEFVNSKAQEFSTALQKEANTDKKDLDDALTQAVKQVAEDKKIAYVLSSPLGGPQGIQQVMLYSSDKDIDITKQVLAAVNKLKS